MDTFKHFNIDKNQHGIVWLTMDVAGSQTNVLSQAVLDELKLALNQVAQDLPLGLMITSGKSGGFIAGADVKEFTHIESHDDALVLIKNGQAVMNCIEAMDCPTVAVINGFCLGGGLELALACDFRIALDDPKVRLGFPEIKLGIHPGFGGTVRAVRVLGPLSAMDLMLTGRNLTVKQALRIGLIDHSVPERLLCQAAEALITNKPSLKKAKKWQRMLNYQPFRQIVSKQMQKQVAPKAKKEHYPAPYALIDLWRQFGGNEAKMMKQEADSVAKLSVTETARNLVRVFMLQDQLKSKIDKSAIEASHVHVIGAGVMGGDIAVWCALRGLTVTLEDTYKPGIATAMQRAQAFYVKRFRSNPTLVNAAMDKLIPDPAGKGVRKADVIIEAIFEDIEAKQNLYQRIEPIIKPDALLATNTSSIRLDVLSECLSDPGRLVGLHFFNPVAKMPLLEVVRSEVTRKQIVAQALAFSGIIDKLAITVKGSPGFLVNRVLMPYMLEAVLMIEEGLPKSVIDKTAKDFGMPMGPIELADRVGLDVCLFVAKILSKELGFNVPSQLSALVDAKNLGRKTGLGFYRYHAGKLVKPDESHFSGDRVEIQDRLINRLTNEAIACLREGVVDHADTLDAGIIFGTGFAPFRGGPLHYLDAVSHQRKAS